MVGDAAADAARVVGSFDDDRMRFVDLPYCGPYPKRREDAWLVGGTTPHNTGLALGRGQWIGVVDDDEALRPTGVRGVGSAELRDALRLRYLPLEPTDWLFGIAHDGGLLEQMLRIGVRFAMHDDLV